jgi:predicted Zn-dependent peptidase
MNPGDADTHLVTLHNGVRVLSIRIPQRQTVNVSVFVHTGSQHESARLNGISHMVEHMAFKGTHERDCQRINLDAERLGAEVNAHTDKDHSAFHMIGLARDAEAFVHMLGDIVQHSSFPEDELERERQVILHEFAEDEDDALAAAFRLFDKTCFGAHPVAQPVIGNRRNIGRLSRADLLGYVQRQYSGANIVVGVAGDVDPERIAQQVQASFASLPRGMHNQVASPDYRGGIAARRIAGSAQTHIVLGFPIPALKQQHHASTLAAALFGEGMSSPLMDQLRERRGLVYYAACSADVMELCGQWVIEASTGPQHVDEFFVEVTRLLHAHAETTDAVGLQRARNQIMVRGLRAHERPVRRLEAAAMDLLALGRVRSRAEIDAALQAVTAQQVREAFAEMLASGASIAIAGKVRNGLSDRVRELTGPLLRAAPADLPRR